MNPIETRLRAVNQQLQQAAQACGRSVEEITLLAVSKNHSSEEIRQALQAGCRHFGESYLQEALNKIEQLRGQNIIWHFIGPIQSNKTQAIARHFHWVHSVDRVKIAQRRNDQRPQELPPLNVCLQVNISGESSKSGVSLSRLGDLARQVAGLPRLKLRGLMTIARKGDTAEQNRAGFAQLRQALQQLNSSGLSLDTLSMGMTADMGEAIAEGATIVRVGTGIFGPRHYS